MAALNTRGHRTDEAKEEQLVWIHRGNSDTCEHLHACRGCSNMCTKNIRRLLFLDGLSTRHRSKHARGMMSIKLRIVAFVPFIPIRQLLWISTSILFQLRSKSTMSEPFLGRLSRRVKQYSALSVQSFISTSQSPVGQLFYYLKLQDSEYESKQLYFGW